MRCHMFAAVLLAVTSDLNAQRLDGNRVAVARQLDEPRFTQPTTIAPVATQPVNRVGTRTLVMAGLIGGAVGAFGGAVAGMSVENCGSRPEDDMCGVAGGAIGFLIGEAIGVPLGINWVMNSRGTLGRSIPASLGITVGSLAIPGAFVLAIPAQIWTSIRIERKAS
jgi:hypothetical protein